MLHSPVGIVYDLSYVLLVYVLFVWSVTHGSVKSVILCVGVCVCECCGVFFVLIYQRGRVLLCIVVSMYN